MKTSLHFLFLFLTILSTSTTSAQQLSSAEIYEELEKFGVLAKVLFVAAHPDDENTRMISYLSNDVKADTRYLSLTRGDGGQNSIGPEIKELLGVIRTHELLGARSIDGGSQMFTRANDFGYSKNAEETIKIWDDEKVLSDVVWAIRTFKPDVIINRFDHTTSGRTHGHHTASAILSHKAFDLAGDKKQFAEQLKYTDVWQPRRQFFNTSWWFYGSREKFAEADKSKLMSVDIGAYYPLKGLSNNEIAAASRSMHKCQSMGSTPSRGSQLEYLEILNGDMPQNKSDILEDIETSWKRVKGGKKVAEQVKSILKNYDFGNPAASIKSLVSLKAMVEKLPDNYWKEQKLEDLKQIIASAAGLFFETVANKNAVTPGAPLEFSTEVVKRLSADITLVGFSIEPNYIDTTFNLPLADNERILIDKKIEVSDSAPTTAPYWLKNKGTLGMYKVERQEDIGKPTTDRYFKAVYKMKIEGEPFTFVEDVDYKFTHPERGEVHEPLEIVEEVYARLENKVYVFGNAEPKEVNVTVQSAKDNQSGEVSLQVPSNWNVQPLSHTFSLENAGEEQTVKFFVSPPKKQSVAEMSPLVKANGKTYTNELIKINYEHIPLQRVALPSTAKLVKVDIEKKGNKVLYVEGAGDEVPSSLEQIGYDVTVISPAEINADLIKSHSAVVLGIRAYNSSADLAYKQKVLFDYVENGGTLITQFNVTRRLKTKSVGPYPMQLSRKRVSVEEAPVTIIAKDHPIVTYPNTITSEDFDGWVQERGLYFSDEWDENYVPILSSNDPGEEAQKGGLLAAKFGEGYFIYTGYSWFRQLPAGVPGAYRLFANMLSLTSAPRP